MEEVTENELDGDGLEAGSFFVEGRNRADSNVSSVTSIGASHSMRTSSSIASGSEERFDWQTASQFESNGTSLEDISSTTQREDEEEPTRLLSGKPLLSELLTSRLRDGHLWDSEMEMYGPLAPSKETFHTKDSSETTLKVMSFSQIKTGGRYEMNELFLDTWCLRNGDGTKDLVLIGSRLEERISRRADDGDVKTIFRFLNKRPNVVGVDLSYNSITEKSFDIHIVAFLKNNKTLKYLNLANNDINGDGLLTFAEFGKYYSLTELRLNGNPLGPEGGLAIAYMLSRNTSLIHLDLGQTDQNMSSSAAIVAHLNKRYCPAMCELHGMQNRPSSPVAERMCPVKNTATAEEEGVAVIMKDIPRWRDANSEAKYYLWKLAPEIKSQIHPPINRNLRILNLDRILPHYHYELLTDHLARNISDMLENNECLIELHLEKNGLTDPDIEVLCVGLAQNITLRLLNLASNCIYSCGAEYLAEAIKTSKLEALILNHNQISNVGATSLCYAIPFSRLRFIDLAYNQISDPGMISLMNAVRNKVLVFYIWGNPISNEAIDQASHLGLFCEKQTCLILIIRDYIYTGAILSEGLDMEIEQERSRVKAAFVCADKYKSRYYGGAGGLRPLRKMAPPPQMYLPNPVNFVHRDVIYARVMQTSIPPKGINKVNLAHTCTY